MQTDGVKGGCVAAVAGMVMMAVGGCFLGYEMVGQRGVFIASMAFMVVMGWTITWHALK